MSVAKINPVLNCTQHVAILRPGTLTIVPLAVKRLKVIATELDARRPT